MLRGWLSPPGLHGFLQSLSQRPCKMCKKNEWESRRGSWTVEQEALMIESKAAMSRHCIHSLVCNPIHCYQYSPRRYSLEGDLHRVVHIGRWFSPFSCTSHTAAVVDALVLFVVVPSQRQPRYFLYIPVAQYPDRCRHESHRQSWLDTLQ